MNSDNDPAKSASIPRPLTPTTLGQRALVEGMTPETSSLSVEDITQSFTLSDVEASLGSTAEPSTKEELAGDGLVLSGTLKNISKGHDGGYLLTLEVGENDRDEVAALISHGNKVFKVVLVPDSLVAGSQCEPDIS